MSKDQPMNWSDFAIKGENPPGEDHYDMKPCLRILFYFQGSIKTSGDAIMHFYSRALPLVKQDSKISSEAVQGAVWQQRIHATFQEQQEDV